MRIIILYCVMCVAAFTTKAQSYYQFGEHTISLNIDNATYIYKYSNDDFYIELQNSTNKYIGTPMDYTNGRKMVGAENVLPEAFTTRNSIEETYSTMVSLFENIITQIDGESVRKNINHYDPLFLVLAVSPSTGKIIEVHYRIAVGDGFDEVSPKAYYYIEKALKENISFNITDVGRQLNYLPIAYLIFMPEKK